MSEFQRTKGISWKSESTQALHKSPFNGNIVFLARKIVKIQYPLLSHHVTQDFVFIFNKT